MTVKLTFHEFRRKPVVQFLISPHLYYYFTEDRDRNVLILETAPIQDARIAYPTSQLHSLDTHSI